MPYPFTIPIIHPFLFAVSPVLFLFAHNIMEAELPVVIIPVITVSLFMLMLLFVFWVFVRDARKAALLTSFTLITFFSYGPFSSVADKFPLCMSTFPIGPRTLIFSAGGIVLLLSCWFIVKTRRNLRNLTKTFNLIASFLVLFSLLTIGAHEITRWRTGRNNRGKDVERTGAALSDNAVRLPDVYYIILDGYGRADILKELYGYDNAEFIDYLRKKGFYIAGRSKSNYDSTYLSLASSLNLSYLEPDDFLNKIKKYRSNKVFSTMKRYGYTNFFISSLDNRMMMNNADAELGIGWLNNFWNGQINEFFYGFISLTPLSDLLVKLNLLKRTYSLQRERINFAFDAVLDKAESSAPVFVYAHIMALHPPFVFDRDGGAVQPEMKNRAYNLMKFYNPGGTGDEYIKSHNMQIRYINKRLVKLIDSILDGEDSFSVIILQGDHGSKLGASLPDSGKPYWQEEYAILNAYYLPGEGNEALYESITPVNTFRLVFNLYFKEKYELLDDRSYFCDFRLPLKIVDVTDKVDNY